MWFLRFLLGIVSNILLGLVDILGKSIDNIFDTMYKLNKLLNLDDAKNFIVEISLILICIFFVKNAFGTYVLRTEGDYEEDPLESLVRITKCAAMILCGDWLIDFGVKLAGQFTSDLTALIPTSKKSFTNTLVDILGKAMGMGTILDTIQCILIIVIFVFYIIFIGKAAIRGGDLILHQLLMPFMALDILNANDERWRNYTTDLMVCIFGYAIQVMCFNIFLKLYSNAISTSGLLENPYSLIAALTWLGFVINGPKWIQKYLYRSGIGNVVKGGARSALHYVPQLLRR